MDRQAQCITDDIITDQMITNAPTNVQEDIKSIMCVQMDSNAQDISQTDIDGIFNDQMNIDPSVQSNTDVMTTDKKFVEAGGSPDSVAEQLYAIARAHVEDSVTKAKQEPKHLQH